MKYIFLILVFLSFKCRSQEKVYLKFEEGKLSKCQMSSYRDGRDKKESNYIPNKGEIGGNKVVFKICSQFFVYNPRKDKIITQLPKNVNYITIDEMMRKQELEEYRFDKSKTYKKIFLIEMLPDNRCKIYPVVWSNEHYWEDVDPR